MSEIVRRYVQHHIRPHDGLRPLDFDGISEVWYDNIESANSVRDLPGVDHLREDEARFLDMTATRAVMLDHQVIQIGSSIRIDGRP